MNLVATTIALAMQNRIAHDVRCHRANGMDEDELRKQVVVSHDFLYETLGRTWSTIKADTVALAIAVADICGNDVGIRILAQKTQLVVEAFFGPHTDFAPYLNPPAA